MLPLSQVIWIPYLKNGGLGHSHTVEYTYDKLYIFTVLYFVYQYEFNICVFTLCISLRKLQPPILMFGLSAQIDLPKYLQDLIYISSLPSLVKWIQEAHGEVCLPTQGIHLGIRCKVQDEGQP